MASGAAIDDVRITASHDLCGAVGAADENYIVYASNESSTQSIDAAFKYDSNPSRQHFILFDADFNPVTDRFPKFHTRRLKPRESVRIGCTYTFRAAPSSPAPLRIPLVITKQTAAYVDANSAEPAPENARAFAAFILQGGSEQCGAGARPPGLVYLVNLHPDAKLSASFNSLDDRGTRIGAKALELPALGISQVGCSNGNSKPSAITDATLEFPAAITTSLPAVPQPIAAHAASVRPSGEQSATAQPSTAPVAAAHSTAVAQSQLADELFAVFVDLRSSIVFENSVAHFEDPRFYSRAWLEEAIRGALKAAKQPDRPGLNRTQDSLMARLSVGMVVKSVFRYESAPGDPSRLALRMLVTDQCDRPSTNTIEFVREEGAWRVNRTNYDSSRAGMDWFKRDLTPIKTFPDITLRDRTRYFNESNLGRALQLNVEDKKCSQ